MKHFPLTETIKDAMFSTDDDYSLDFFTDFLQERGIFRNGISGATSHCDSYMTVVDFSALDESLTELADFYAPTKAEWEYLANKIHDGLNMQPPLRIVARYILMVICKIVLK